MSFARTLYLKPTLQTIPGQMGGRPQFTTDSVGRPIVTCATLRVAHQRPERGRGSVCMISQIKKLISPIVQSAESILKSVKSTNVTQYLNANCVRTHEF